MDGSDRGPMERRQHHPARGSGTTRSTRSALERSAPSAQWGAVDSANRGTVEGFARALWGVSNGASALSELGTLASLGASAPGGGPGFEGSGRPRSPRVFYRRNVRSGEKGGLGVGKTKRGKGSKIMAITDRHGLPVAISTTSASPAEVTLVAQTVDQRFVPDPPGKLVGDKAYDSDPLDEKMLSEYGTDVVAPHREGRRAAKTQDGRVLRRYRKRWRVERFFAWLNNYRRVVIRWEHHAENYLGFLHLACLVIFLRNL